jgi:hypothetical protein
LTPGLSEAFQLHMTVLQSAMITEFNRRSVLNF